jgi:hypothetical protein
MKSGRRRSRLAFSLELLKTLVVLSHCSEAESLAGLLKSYPLDLCSKACCSAATCSEYLLQDSSFRERTDSLR